MAESTGTHRVLIPNRGEIAVRIIQACRDLGMTSVLAHSVADEGSRAHRLADETICIGPAAPAGSYLNPQAIVGAALAKGCTMVHPGYGFLSENADFAALCEKEGLVFVGPTSDSIALLADKLQARAVAVAAGVPVAPGAEVDPADGDGVRARAAEVGFPLLVKASGGGGGRGMRLVESADALASAVESAAAEAQNAFGNPRVYLERFVPRARHVEVQVLGDGHGRVIAVGDRDCTLQRRHQKVVEEAPAPFLSDTARAAMTDAATHLAAHLSYRSAGTVEFILDPTDETFFFLEVNTRIQVEHPVSEEVTGTDLVATQLLLAADPVHHALPAEAPVTRGHALECRITAEDAVRGFLPRPGDITAVQWPTGAGVRVETGIDGPATVTPYYDSMLAKLVVWGPTREQARQRMLRALAETRIDGIVTNLDFLRWVLATTEFTELSLHTSWIQDGGQAAFKAHTRRGTP